MRTLKVINQKYLLLRYEKIFVISIDKSILTLERRFIQFLFQNYSICKREKEELKKRIPAVARIYPILFNSSIIYISSSQYQLGSS